MNQPTNLAYCTACRYQVSPMARACPHCGHPFHPQVAPAKKGFLDVGCGGVLVLILLVPVFLIALFLALVSN